MCSIISSAHVAVLTVIAILFFSNNWQMRHVPQEWLLFPTFVAIFATVNMRYSSSQMSLRRNWFSPIFVSALTSRPWDSAAFPFAMTEQTSLLPLQAAVYRSINRTREFFLGDYGLPVQEDPERYIFCRCSTCCAANKSFSVLGCIEMSRHGQSTRMF